MSWTSWTLFSAVFLALYDLCKKASVRDNAVLPVLLCSTMFGFAVFALGMLAVGRFGEMLSATPMTMAIGLTKSVIVGTSWIFTFTALRTLPITIATPIRASSPVLVFVAALFLYGEVPTWLQGGGMLLVFVGYLAFSWAGKAEGIDFLHNRAVWCAVAGAIFSAISSLFDKFVFQLLDLPTEGVQFYFQAGLVMVYAIAMGGRRLFGGERHEFEWRWTIPLVGTLLAGADWLYFHALDIPAAPVSVVALLRRFSVAITFVLGAFCFHETNLSRKAIALVAVLLGVALICL